MRVWPRLQGTAVSHRGRGWTNWQVGLRAKQPRATVAAQLQAPCLPLPLSFNISPSIQQAAPGSPACGLPEHVAWSRPRSALRAWRGATCGPGTPSRLPRKAWQSRPVLHGSRDAGRPAHPSPTSSPMKTFKTLLLSSLSRRMTTPPLSSVPSTLRSGAGGAKVIQSRVQVLPRPCDVFSQPPEQGSLSHDRLMVVGQIKLVIRGSSKRLQTRRPAKLQALPSRSSVEPGMQRRPRANGESAKAQGVQPWHLNTGAQHEQQRGMN